MPVARLEGEVVAANLLEGNHETPDYTGVPSAVFTIPELARVGLLEAEASEQGLDVDIRFTDMSDWYSIERVGERHAAAKVLVERGSGRIVGAHLLRPEASELINIFGPAMRTASAPPTSSGWSAPTRRAAPTSAISCRTRGGELRPARCASSSARARNAARLTQIMVAGGQCVTIDQFGRDAVRSGPLER